MKIQMSKISPAKISGAQTFTGTLLNGADKIKSCVSDNTDLLTKNNKKIAGISAFSAIAALITSQMAKLKGKIFPSDTKKEMNSSEITTQEQALECACKIRQEAEQIMAEAENKLYDVDLRYYSYKKGRKLDREIKIHYGEGWKENVPYMTETFYDENNVKIQRDSSFMKGVTSKTENNDYVSTIEEIKDGKKYTYVFYNMAEKLASLTVSDYPCDSTTKVKEYNFDYYDGSGLVSYFEYEGERTLKTKPTVEVKFDNSCEPASFYNKEKQFMCEFKK